jgi:hypothetical protein
MLIRYLVRYLLSKRFNLSHGTLSQSEQNLAFSPRKVTQFFIMQSLQETGLPASGPLQPGHLLRSLRKA